VLFIKKVKSITALLVFFFCLSFVIPGTAAADEIGVPLSIQEALELAYSNNPDLRLAELEVKKAQILRDDAADALTWFPSEGVVSKVFNQVFNGYQQAEIGLTTARKGEKAAQDQITKEVVTAYTEALKNYNNLQALELTLKNIKELHVVSSAANSIGFISSYDYQKSITGTQQAEEGLRAARLAYEGSIANLRSLLGQHPGWNPVLTSEALITEYERGELSIEIIKGSSESVLVWTKGALLDIEKSKEDWILPDLSSEMKEINLTTAELNYEDAKRTARVLIEQMYYGIDAIEGQIKMAELAYKTAVKDEEVARLKYDLGLIPKVSLIPNAENLESAVLATSQAKINLSNLKLQLADLKAQYAFLTGETVYDDGDWSRPPAAEEEV
jgi:outer membrane protein TolC